jgi:hypothetical protein
MAYANVIMRLNNQLPPAAKEYVRNASGLYGVSADNIINHLNDSTLGGGNSITGLLKLRDYLDAWKNNPAVEELSNHIRSLINSDTHKKIAADQYFQQYGTPAWVQAATATNLGRPFQGFVVPPVVTPPVTRANSHVLTLEEDIEMKSLLIASMTDADITFIPTDDKLSASNYKKFVSAATKKYPHSVCGAFQILNEASVEEEEEDMDDNMELSPSSEDERDKKKVVKVKKTTSSGSDDEEIEEEEFEIGGMQIKVTTKTRLPKYIVVQLKDGMYTNVKPKNPFKDEKMAAKAAQSLQSKFSENHYAVYVLLSSTRENKPKVNMKARAKVITK